MCDSTPIGHWSKRCNGTGGVTGASSGAEVDLTGGGPDASDHKFPAALGPVDRPRLGYAASEDALGWCAKSVLVGWLAPFFGYFLQVPCEVCATF